MESRNTPNEERQRLDDERMLNDPNVPFDEKQRIRQRMANQSADLSDKNTLTGITDPGPIKKESPEVKEANSEKAAAQKIQNTSAYQLDSKSKTVAPPDTWPNGEPKTEHDKKVDRGEVSPYVWPDGTPKLATTILNEQIREKSQAEIDAARRKQAERKNYGSFTHEGKSYNIYSNRMEIPGRGVMTAMDIQSDREAQQFLVNAKSPTIEENF